MEQLELELDIDLMPHHREVDSPTSMHPYDEQVSNDQGGTEILGGQLEVEMQNNSFDESQHRVVYPNRVPNLEDQTSPTQVEEQVIMTDVQRTQILWSMQLECMPKTLAPVFDSS